MAVLGCVERVNREKIIGWVFDQQKPDRRYVVELYVGERQVASAPATTVRSDARRGARKQTGYGFELSVPYGTQLDVAQMGVRVIGADIMLPVSDDATRLEGVLDFVAGSAIGGWAWHTGRPTERVSVIVRHKGKILTKVAADGFRQDLFEAGVGDGAHGFIVDLGAAVAMAPLVLDDVEVVFEATDGPLFNLVKHRSAVSSFGNRIGG
ncbi:hypothetical protein [Bradyrhizobium prioriisuperbiae]|uniref:hypothetical protein n=1 Tax=Bradyrhizobium prioriisuperbiae TaxID=2854389 RepID=UPI0028EB0A79|nr:hypothetical protein [Bradyrhizobium prioritasuperba]